MLQKVIIFGEGNTALQAGIFFPHVGLHFDFSPYIALQQFFK